jgi:hypothetical protein
LKKKQTKKCRIYRLLLTFDKINVIVRSLLDFRVSVARFFLPKKVVPLACGSETNNYAEAQPSSIKYYLLMQFKSTKHDPDQIPIHADNLPFVILRCKCAIDDFIARGVCCGIRDRPDLL